MPTRAPFGRIRAAAAALILVVLASLVPAATASAASSFDLESRYDVGLHLDWDTRWIGVTTTIEVHNTSGRAIDRLQLNTVAAKLGSMRNLRATVNGAGRKVTRMGQTLTVPLGSQLAPGATTTVFVGYRARLRSTTGGRSYLFAKLDGVAQLYRFIPWVSRRIPFGNSNHGEQFVTPVSPRVTVTASADRKLKWATSGRQVKKLSERKFRFVAKDVRDFNIAVSPRYRTATGITHNGKTRIIAHTVRHDGKRLVQLAKQEIARYASLTGVPYPYETYRIAETGGGLAMESPALIWIPRSRPAADHPYLVSHETAHQWWYSSVGNDQSTDAFADEALADYFSRKKHLSIRTSRCATDRLDRDTQAYSDGCYFEVIYVQGARFLDKLRKDYGSTKFRAAIRTYTKSNSDGISNNARLLEAFRVEMGDGVLPRYRNRFPSIY